MNVVIEPLAQETIEEIAEFAESVNTAGAGDRWTDKILDFIIGYAQPNAQYALCNNKELARQLLSCIVFNNWVIAFRIERNVLTVYQIIHGSLLK